MEDNFLREAENDRNRVRYIKDADDYMLRDIIDRNLHGKDTAVTLDYWSDDKAFSESGKFIPGCLYTFKYSGAPIRTGAGVFDDKIPLLLALSSGRNPQAMNKKYVFGINLNCFSILPLSLAIKVKAAIIQELHDADINFFNRLDREHAAGHHVYSQGLVDMFVRDAGKSFVKMLGRKYKINTSSWAFRMYYTENISGCRLVEYWQWKLIPYLDIKKGISGDLDGVRKNIMDDDLEAKHSS